MIRIELASCRPLPINSNQTAFMLAIKPDLPVIICAGFSERISRERVAAHGIKGLLMKPIVKPEMAQMIRKVLDEAKCSTQEG